MFQVLTPIGEALILDEPSWWLMVLVLVVHCAFVFCFDRYVFLFDKVLLMCKARVNISLWIIITDCLGCIVFR